MRAVWHQWCRGTRAAKRHLLAPEGSDLDQQDDNQIRQARLATDELEALATDAFNAFSTNREGWPDKVTFDRSGYTDVNIVGTWLDGRTPDYFNVPFATRARDDAPEMGLQPDDSGGRA